MQTFKPLGNKVLVQRLPEENKTPSGIIIPDAAKERPVRGLVVAVGPGSTDRNGNVIPMEVNEADVVIFPMHAGNNVKLEGGGDLLIMSEDEIMGILRAE
jgi:chaperonin GroES